MKKRKLPAVFLALILTVTSINAAYAFEMPDDTTDMEAEENTVVPASDTEEEETEPEISDEETIADFDEITETQPEETSESETDETSEEMTEEVSNEEKSEAAEAETETEETTEDIEDDIIYIDRPFVYDLSWSGDLITYSDMVPDSEADENYSYRSLLSTSEQKIYDAVEEKFQTSGITQNITTKTFSFSNGISFTTYALQVDISTSSIGVSITADSDMDYWDHISNVGMAYMYDNPEEAWICSFTANVSMLYDQRISTIHYYFISTSDYDTIISDLSALDNWTDSVISAANTYSETYEKLKYMHDELCTKTSYNYNALSLYFGDEEFRYAHAASGIVALNNQVVCDGYAKAYKILCDRLNIPCLLMSNSDHMWNIVQMDDEEWYGIDTTWDDGNTITYNYFLKGTVVFEDHSYTNPFNFELAYGDYTILTTNVITTETASFSEPTTEISTETTTTAVDTSTETTTKTASSSSGSGGGGGGGGGSSSTCLIKFVPNNGINSSSIYVKKNGTLTEPDTPVYDGYTFTGWYTDSDCTTLYDFSSIVTSSFTLYGGWKEAGEDDETDENETETEIENETENEEIQPETKESVIERIVKVVIGSTIVTIETDGQESTYTMDTVPYIQTESNSTLVPLRFVAVAVYGDKTDDADSSNIITWDAETKTASISVGNDIISFTAGSEYMSINGKDVLMSNGVKAEITDGRMFIPFRALGEALNVEVDWDSTTKTAIYTAE